MIARATVENLTDLKFLELAGKFFPESKIPGTFVPEAFVKHWTQFFNLNVGAIWMALKDGQMIGAIGVIAHPSIYDDVLMVQEAFWFMSPEHRNGIAAVRLYCEVEKWASEIGAGRLGMACTCNTHITSLRKFYEKQGFRPVDISFIKEL